MYGVNKRVNLKGKPLWGEPPIFRGKDSFDNFGSIIKVDFPGT